MSRVICDLPNASLEISGVRFQKLDDGRFISDEIGDEATALFLSIPGYVLDEDEAEPVKAPASAPAAAAKTKKQLADEKKLAAPKPVVSKPAADPVIETEPVTPPVTTGDETLLVDPVVETVTEAAAVTGEGDAPKDPVNPEDTADKPTDVF